jgi:hypothetical protein
MADNEKLTPEEEDVRNQAMLQDLRSMHAPAATAQSLERVRTRLLATERTSTLNSMPTSRQFMRKTKQGRIQSMHDIQVPIAQKKGHYLNILIASIIATLLVGSLLFAVTRVYQSNIGGGGPVTPQVPIKKATATPEPAFSGDPDWKIVATFRGTGSTTITKLHLKFPYAIVSFLVCTGKGDLQIRYDRLGTMGFGGSCHSMAKGELFEWNVKASVAVEMVSIIVDKNSSWKLELINCINRRSCNPGNTVTPTPVPTSISSPTPTPAPGSILTPTPMPILTPTVVPGSNPIPLPTPTLVPSH